MPNPGDTARYAGMHGSVVVEYIKEAASLTDSKGRTRRYFFVKVDGKGRLWSETQLLSVFGE